MCHLAMREGPEDPRTPETEWGEHITDDEYAGR
jgi:hypothetical protein